VLSALPFISVGNCCCLWIIGGGFLTAYLDSQNSRRTLPIARGALDGFLAGVLGAFVWLVAAIVLDALIGPMQRRFAEEVARQSQTMPPEMRAWFETLSSRTTSPFRWALGFFLQLFIGMVFAPIGGMLGAAFFKKDVPPALGGNDAPPLLP
jgi:hypothetical protein